MRVAGALSLQPVLRAGYRDGGQLAADAADRPGVHGPPVPRQPAADEVAERAGGGGQPQAGAAADAAHWAGGLLPLAPAVRRRAPTQGLPRLAAVSCHNTV